MIIPNENNKTDNPNGLNEIKNQISLILTQNQIAVAAEHARSGNYSAAEEILESISNKDQSHEVLELRAKISSQQKDYENAICFWTKALKINPSCPECNAGLQKTKSILSSKFPAYWIQRVLILLVILVGASLLLNLIFRMNKLEKLIPKQIKLMNIPTAVFQNSEIKKEISLLSSQQETIVNILENDHKQLNEISEKISEINNTSVPTQAATIIPSIIDQISLHTKNLAVVVNEQEIEITFDEGLFLYNWLLSEEGKSTLISLGNELANWADDIIINVIGFIDSTEVNISELSYFRSYKVVEFLTNNCQLSEDNFIILPKANRHAPFPNDTMANRSRNRTVKIIITEKFDID